MELLFPENILSLNVPTQPTRQAWYCAFFLRLPFGLLSQRYAKQVEGRGAGL